MFRLRPRARLLSLTAFFFSSSLLLCKTAHFQSAKMLLGEWESGRVGEDGVDVVLKMALFSPRWWLLSH